MTARNLFTAAVIIGFLLLLGFLVAKDQSCRERTVWDDYRASQQRHYMVGGVR